MPMECTWRKADAICGNHTHHRVYREQEGGGQRGRVRISGRRAHACTAPSPRGAWLNCNPKACIGMLPRARVHVCNPKRSVHCFLSSILLGSGSMAHGPFLQPPPHLAHDLQQLRLLEVVLAPEHVPQALTAQFKLQAARQTGPHREVGRQPGGWVAAADMPPAAGRISAAGREAASRAPVHVVHCHRSGLHTQGAQQPQLPPPRAMQLTTTAGLPSGAGAKRKQLHCEDPCKPPPPL